MNIMRLNFSSSRIGSLLILMMALFVSAAHAEEKSIRAKIVDYSSRADLSGVGVEIRKNGESMLTQDGLKSPLALSFDYEQDGEYKLVVKKEGYPDYTLDLSSAVKSGAMPDPMVISLGGERTAFLFKGKALDRDALTPLQGTRVVVTNKMTGEVTEQSTDYEGTYTVNVIEGYEYGLMIHNPDFLRRHGNINFCGDRLKKNNKYCFMGFVDLSLDPSGGVRAATVFMDKIEVGKRFKVENIYYDYNKATLQPAAFPNLDKLFHILTDNRQISVELGSHADARGSDEYNLKLSQARAESAVSYIVVDKGIDPKRITAKGYGEGLLLNRCANNVKCSDEEHAVNRRTEFTITAVDESLKED